MLVLLIEGKLSNSFLEQVNMSHTEFHRFLFLFYPNALALVGTLAMHGIGVEG